MESIRGWRSLFAVGCLLAVLTSGCTSVSSGSMEAVKLAIHRHATVHPTAASVAAQPYFQLQVSSHDGEAILILASVQGAWLGWYGADGQAVFLRNGLLVKTLGLTQNLDAVQLPDQDPFAAGLQHVREPLEYSRVMDWSPDYRYGVTARAQMQPKAIENVTILGTVHRLRRIDERVRSAEAGFDVVNRYWVDPVDGFVWKSRQYVAPGLVLELTQLRPYGEPQS
ncbi:YjbF family lipoprotein [Dyella silvatica]|uniref:YjbF family lipoprotein n=1 Tax=Dyella silvatica TaxID=2992128 RepID=UPI002253B1C3|nr:YjbF family lipoprotein [Dyella silvatica]